MYMNQLEPVTLLTALAGATIADRARRHGVDQLLRALQRCPPVLLARPHHRREGGLERRHVCKRLRRPQFRSRQAAAAWAALRARRRVRRRGEAALEHLGRGCLRLRPQKWPLFRAGPHACHPSRGEVLQRRWRSQYRPLAAGPSGDHPGRRLGHGSRARRPHGRGGVRERRRSPERQEGLRRPQGTYEQVRTRSRHSAHPRRHAGDDRPHAAGGRGKAHAAAGADAPRRRPLPARHRSGGGPFGPAARRADPGKPASQECQSAQGVLRRHHEDHPRGEPDAAAALSALRAWPQDDQGDRQRRSPT